MKTFLFLLIIGLLVSTGVVFVHYAPVCTREFACPVETDIRGNIIRASCTPTVRDMQNKYQAYLLKATIIHEGACTAADREIRR
jgi:hypothetical protein